MQPDPLSAEEPLATPLANDDENEDESTPAPEVVEGAPEFRAFARAVELLRKKTKLSSDLKDVDDELKRLQPLVFTYFAQHGIKRIRITGVTLYLRRELWARPKLPGHQPQVCAVMRETGYGHFVHDAYNASTFSAHIRDLEREHAEEIRSGKAADVSAFLPRALANVLNVTPSFKLMGKFSDR